MKAAILTRSGFKITELDKPSCGRHQVLVKTLVCGVCEGDTYKYKNITGASTQTDNDERILFGHEGCGRVVETGSCVTNVKKDDIVVAIGGKYSEYFLEEAANVYKIPENLKPEYTLGEPLACCIHAANRFGIKLGDKVAVIGCGFMGLICISLVNLQGAAIINAFDLVDWRLENASKFGADEVFTPSDITIKNAGKFDVVIEAAGTQTSLDIAGELVREHGRIIIMGAHNSNGGVRSIIMNLWNYKSIDVVNGHVRDMTAKMEAMKAGIRLLEHNRLDLAPLVTEYSFSDINKGFKDIIEKKKGLYKAVIRFCSGGDSLK